MKRTISDLHIDDLRSAGDAAHHAAAEVLCAAFGTYWPDAWPTLRDGIAEVQEMLGEDRIARAAFIGDTLVGWIGGIPQYEGHVWELHPLAVHPLHQRQGIGRALVEDFEARVRERDADTILLGADDVSGMTSLSGVNLFENTWQHIAAIRNLKGHPYEFYQRMGYVIVGVVPDANGSGRPDIIMAKAVQA